VRSNRSAIGARIAVTVTTAAGAEVIHASVTSGGSFGASPLRQTIGLGEARAIQSVDVRWPSGLTQRFANVAMDATYRLREGASAPARVRTARRWPSLRNWFAAEAPAPSLHPHHR
jgi:hypothetical protein